MCINVVWVLKMGAAKNDSSISCPHQEILYDTLYIYIIQNDCATAKYWTHLWKLKNLTKRTHCILIFNYYYHHSIAATL